MYEVNERLAAGLVRLRHPQYGMQVWSCVVTRKIQVCAQCRMDFARGVQMYRPLTNGHNRMERVCEECVARLVG